jgi:two-component system, response regulator PdtaR
VFYDEKKVALVVDDEPFARLMAIQILMDHGFFPLEAEDAAAGLQMLDGNADIALVFSDIRMPGDMDGVGLIREARKSHPRAMLVLTSGEMEPPAADLGPGVSFLAKPYTAHALGHIIREAARADHLHLATPTAAPCQPASASASR